MQIAGFYKVKQGTLADAYYGFTLNRGTIEAVQFVARVKVCRNQHKCAYLLKLEQVIRSAQWCVFEGGVPMFLSAEHSGPGVRYLMHTMGTTFAVSCVL